jgi:O-antigen/teichoic acid export membrane protein
MRLRELTLRRVVHGKHHLEVRRFGRAAGLLAGGIGLAGVLTYLYFALASHQLDPNQYGEIVVLWSAAFVAISVLYRPVELLLSRTLAEREARGQASGGTLRVAALIQSAIAVACLLGTLALREPLQDDLLSGNETLYWILVGTLAGYAAHFFARGFLAGRRQFRVLAALILGDAVVRLLFALAVAVGISSGQVAVALGVAVAPCLCLLLVPLAIKWRVGMDPAPKAATTVEERSLTFGRGGDFAAGVFVIMLSEQVFLNAGPLLVQASAGAAAAGFIFNVLMLARAPLLLFQGVAMSLLPHLTQLRSGAEERRDAFAHTIRATLGAIALFTALVCLVVLVAGPALMQLAFGDKFSYDRVGLLLVAFGMGPYLAATTLNQAALAKGQARRAAACWALCAAAFLAWNLTGAFDEFRRVEIGFAAGALALSVLLYALYRSPVGRPEDVVAPGSPAEVEARLVATEEAA